MMHKMTIKVAVAAMAAAAFATGSYAVESTKIQATTNATLRATTVLDSALEQPVRAKLLTANSGSSESRSSKVSSTLEESNTVAMLLAGLAIMGLVVRRRMN